MTPTEKIAALRAEVDRLNAEHSRLAAIANAANDAEWAAYQAWSKAADEWEAACEAAYRAEAV